MLLAFHVTNHASLRDEQSLSLVAGDVRPGRVEHGVPGTAHRAVPVAAIYGPNASGKSNALDALMWMRFAVLSSFRSWDPEGGVPRRPFRLRPDPGGFPSTYEMDLVAEGTRYEYGFTVDGDRVLEEWLSYFPEGRRRRLFARKGEGPDAIVFGRWLTGRRKTISELLRPNSLYLSVAAAQGHERLGAVYRWFRNGIQVATDHDFAERLDYTVELFRDSAGSGTRRLPPPLRELLRYADLGVEGLVVQEHDERTKAEQGRITEALEKVLGERLTKVGRFPGHRVQVEHRTHEGVFELDIHEESSGTRTWISMLGPVLVALREGTVLCVDELDARLHPYLTDALVGLFQDPQTNRHGAQLVFSTHEAALLGANARTELFRDQVWFTEKDADTCATRLIPLTDFHVRDSQGGKDNIEKRYLSGRYGALPHLDDTLLLGLDDKVPSGGAHGAGQDTGPGEEPTSGAA
ncbi:MULTISPECIES: AAA family ATPase [unclassified Streptomyces]|uniref:AAA family ATPase n=1 Tax=unclassified Streptomyces TaxID=2593676 RepID=UPI0037213228